MTANKAIRYNAYGINFASAITVPELTPTTAKAETFAETDPIDVTITLGTVPDHIDDPVTSSASHEAAPGKMRLDIEDVARFMVSDGREIIVDPYPGADEHDVRVFLLGTCFGALLHQRGALVLHASGINTEGGAVLFAGASGAGKSTLLAEMMRLGYKMMVDDVSAIYQAGDGDGLVVMPSYPRTRMWADTAEEFAIDTSELQRTRSHMNKFERQLPDQFWGRPAKLRHIFLLTRSDEDGISLDRIPPLQAVPVIVNNTYRKLFVDAFGIRQNHFKLASQIAGQVPLTHVIRPTTTFQVEELAQMVLADLDEF